jgi:hypothetical protein
MGTARAYFWDILFVAVLLCSIALILLLAAPTNRFPHGVAVAIDVFIMLIVIGKTNGVRLGFRSQFFRSALTFGEWIVLVAVLGLVNLVALIPPVIILN